MSSRAWKRTRRKLRATERELDRRGRREMRVPWYIHAIAWMMDRDYRQAWKIQWEQKHREKLHRAMKVTAHVYKGRI